MTTPVSEEKIKGPEKIPMASPVTPESFKDSEKISMNTPVSDETYVEKMHRISFTIPSKYTLETLPEPDDTE